MFKLQPNPTFKARVSISVPGADTPAALTVEFRHLSRSDLRSYFESLGGRGDADALGEIIADWADIDAKYTPENLAALVNNYPRSAMELFDAYRAELLESRRKN